MELNELNCKLKRNWIFNFYCTIVFTISCTNISSTTCQPLWPFSSKIKALISRSIFFLIAAVFWKLWNEVKMFRFVHRRVSKLILANSTNSPLFRLFQCFYLLVVCAVGMYVFAYKCSSRLNVHILLSRTFSTWSEVI